MQAPLQITFRGMSPVASVESLITEHWNRLARFADRVVRGHVIIDVPHRRQRAGRHFSVHVDIAVTGGTIAVTRDPDRTSPQQLDVVIHDVFDAAKRQLEDAAKRRQLAG